MRVNSSDMWETSAFFFKRHFLADFRFYCSLLSLRISSSDPSSSSRSLSRLAAPLISRLLGRFTAMSNVGCMLWLPFALVGAVLGTDLASLSCSVGKHSVLLSTLEGSSSALRLDCCSPPSGLSTRDLFKIFGTANSPPPGGASLRRRFFRTVHAAARASL